MWAAIAIHYTSSVVGAATKYGNEALQIATTVKLTRALWIVPLTFGTALFFRRKSTRLAFPWFIFLFLLSSVVRPYVAAPQVWNVIYAAAKYGLTITLFLIGADLSRKAIAARDFDFRLPLITLGRLRPDPLEKTVRAGADRVPSARPNPTS